MKLAIQGHPTRGKEVIQILESLGGINNRYLSGDAHDVCSYYIDDCNSIKVDLNSSLMRYGYKFYTLEEFEKDFPFKVGDKVIHKEFNDFFEVISFDPESSYPYKIKGVCKFNTKSRVLTKWQPKMKEERFVTLTLDKAKEWYKKGGELKEIALQVFTEAELNLLPKSWEEFCKQGNPIASWRYNIPTKYEALVKLEQLRDCWRQGWVPDYTKTYKKFRIKKLGTEYIVDWSTGLSDFLVFQKEELAKEFLKCFRDLIEKAGDLI